MTRAASLLTRGVPLSDATVTPSDPASTQDNEAAALPPLPAPAGDAVRPAVVQPLACACQTGAPQMVYGLGQFGYDLVSEARLDSLVQKMAGAGGTSGPERIMAFDSRRMLAHLDGYPSDAAAVEWTLSRDGTPIYAANAAARISLSVPTDGPGFAITCPSLGKICDALMCSEIRRTSRLSRSDRRS